MNMLLHLLLALLSLHFRMSMIGSKVQHYPAKDGRKQEGTGLR